MNIYQLYEQQGLQLVPLHANSKKPVFDNWNEAEVGTPIDYWRQYPNAGVGLLHTISRTCCIDVDNIEETRKWFEALEIDYDECRATAKIFQSGKVNREKWLFTFQQRTVPRNLSSFAGPGNCVEFRCATHAGKTVQDVLPPSVHPETQQPYEWITDPNVPIQEIPTVLLRLWHHYLGSLTKKSKTKHEGDGTGPVQAFNQYVLESVTLGGLVEKTGNYKRISRYVFLSNLSTSGKPGLILMTDEVGYSHHLNDPLSHQREGRQGLAFDAFDVYRIHWHNGDWKKALQEVVKIESVQKILEAQDAELLANGHESVANLIKPPPVLRTGASGSKSPVLDYELLYTNDDFGRFVDSIIACTSRINNPVAAFAAALTGIGYCTGGCWTTDERSSTNLYTMIIGDSVVGKTSTVSAMKRALPNELWMNVLGQLSSYAGIEDVLRANPTNPNVLLVPDEVGILMNTIKADRPEEKKIRGMFLSMYNSGLSNYMTRPLAGNTPQIIAGPQLSILGTTTIEALKGGLTRSDVEDGLANRFLYFNSDHYTLKRTPPGRFPDDVLDRLQNIYSMTLQQQGAARMQEPLKVQFTQDAMELSYDTQDELRKDEDRSLLGRWVENAMKIAMLREIYNRPQAPIVDRDQLLWALAISRSSVDHIKWLYDDKLEETDELEARRQFLEKLEQAGGDCNLNFISQRCYLFKKLRGYERKSLLSELVDYGVLAVYEAKLSSGQKEKRVRLIGDPKGEAT